MTSNIKKLLLATTTLAALGLAGVSPAHALALNSSGGGDADPGAIDLSGASESLVISGDGTTDYNTGAITASGGGTNDISVGLDAGTDTITVGNGISAIETITLTQGIVTLNGTVVADDIDIATAGDLITNNTITIANDIDVNGAATFTSGGAVNATNVNLLTGGAADFSGDPVNANVIVTQGVITTDGSTVITGNVSLDTTNASSVTGDIQLGTAGHTFTITGDASTTTSENAAIAGGSGTDNLVLGNTANTFTLSGAITNFEGLDVNGGGTSVISGDFTGVTADVDVTAGSTLDIDSTNFTGVTTMDVDATSTLDIAGATTYTATTTTILSGGSLTTGGTAINGDLDIATGGTLTGDIVLGSSGHQLAINGNTATVSNNLTGGAGTDILALDAASGQTITLSGTITNFEDFDVGTGGTTQVTGTFTGVTADVDVTGNSTLDIDNAFTGVTTLDVASGSTLDVAGSTNITAGTTTIAAGGLLTTANTAIFNGDVNVALNGTDNVTGDIELGNGTHDLTYTGAATAINESINGDAGGTNNLIVNLAAASNELTYSGTIGSDMNGVQITSGNLNIAANTLSTLTTFTAAGNELTLSGTGTLDGVVNGSTGIDTLDVDAGTLGANFDANLGGDADVVTIETGTTITGGASINTAGDADSVTLGAVDFVATSVLDAGAGVDILDLNGTTITTTSFTSGAGADTVNMNAVTINGTFDGNADSGGDVITVDGGTVSVGAAGTVSNVSDINVDSGATFSYASANDFAGTITAGTAGAQIVNITGTGNLTNSGTTIDLGDGTDTLNLGGIVVSGAVDTGDGVDDIDLAGTTVTGTFDAGAAVDTINTSGTTTFSSTFDGGDAAQTLTIDGGNTIFSGAISNLATVTIDNGGTLTLNAGTNYTGTTAEETAGENQTVVLNGANDMTGSTLAFGTGTDVLDVNGTTTLGIVTGGADADFDAAATVTLTDDVAVNDLTLNNTTTAFVTSIDATNDVDAITVAGTLDTSAGGAITLNVADNSVLKVGNSYTIVTDTGLGTSLSGDFDLTDSTIGQFVSFVEDTTTADVYAVTVASTAENTFSSATDIEGDATNLTNITNAILGAPAGNTELDALQTALLATTTTAGAEDVIETVGPEITGAGLVGSLAVSAETGTAINTRTASLRQASQTGLAAGSYASGVQVWTQAFGQYAEQDERDGVKGYDASTIGAAFGADTQALHEDLVLGVAVSYAYTDVDSDNANNTETEVNSYQGTLYGEYTLPEDYFVAANVSYAYNDIDQTRKNVGTGNATATADYDSQQYGAGVSVGKDFDVSYPGYNTGFVVTPSVNVDYLYVDVDDYTETGAAGLSLQNVETEEFQVLELGVSVDAEWTIAVENGGFVKPSLNAGYAFDAINDTVESTASFTGGGASFKTEGFEPDEHSFNVGAGLTYEAANNWEVNAKYDFEIKDDYEAHSGLIRAQYSF